MCSRTKRKCAPCQHDDIQVRFRSWPHDINLCLPQTYRKGLAGADHKQRLGGIFAHNTATVASLKGSASKAFIHYFTLGHLGVGRRICKPCEDRRQHCLKVMSNEPFGGKEVDSVIHPDRASYQKRRGLRWSAGREGQRHTERTERKPARRMRRHKCSYRAYGGAAGRLSWPK